VEPIRVTFALRGGFDDLGRNDLLDRCGMAESLKRFAGPVERNTHRHGTCVVKVTGVSDTHEALKAFDIEETPKTHSA
jgi:hypothetical protein